jgi:outer membrane protein TolC
MASKQKGASLGVLQEEVEAAAKQLKSARTQAANARQAEVKAEQAYDVAQKALAAGVEQVKASTKV